MASEREDGFYWVRGPQTDGEWEPAQWVGNEPGWWLLSSHHLYSGDDFTEIGERITREPVAEREMIDASANAVYHMQQVSHRHAATDDQVELWDAARRLLAAIQAWRPRA